jgi:hypothetical protein
MRSHECERGTQECVRYEAYKARYGEFLAQEANQPQRGQIHPPPEPGAKVQTGDTNVAEITSAAYSPLTSEPEVRSHECERGYERRCVRT